MQSCKFISSLGILALGLAQAASAAVSAPPGIRTYANPVDVDYRYNFEQLNEKISYRTGADPVVVPHRDAYYLFMTLADGYWRSTNLLDWTDIVTNALVSGTNAFVDSTWTNYPQRFYRVRSL